MVGQLVNQFLVVYVTLMSFMGDFIVGIRAQKRNLTDI